MPETALSLVTDACPKYTPAFFFFFWRNSINFVDCGFDLENASECQTSLAHFPNRHFAWSSLSPTVCQRRSWRDHVPGGREGLRTSRRRSSVSTDQLCLKGLRRDNSSNSVSTSLQISSVFYQVPLGKLVSGTTYHFVFTRENGCWGRKCEPLSCTVWLFRVFVCCLGCK